MPENTQEERLAKAAAWSRFSRVLSRYSLVLSVRARRHARSSNRWATWSVIFALLSVAINLINLARLL